MEKAARKVILSPRSATIWAPVVVCSPMFLAFGVLATAASTAPESQSALGAIGLLAIGLFAGCIVYALTSHDNLRHKRLLREGYKARGIVVDIDSGRSIRLKLRYEYQGKIYEEWEPGSPQQGAIGMYVIHRRFEKGETLDIYVDSKSPGNFVVYDKRRSNHVIIE